MTHDDNVKRIGMKHTKSARADAVRRRAQRRAHLQKKCFQQARQMIAVERKPC